MNFRAATSSLFVLVVPALISAWAAPGWCTWQTFSTADGLGAGYVLSIIEDRSGNLWFGTLSGVSRYDGSTWRTFTTADGLAGGLVSSVLEDRSGNLWFGTIAGVSRYDGSTWRTFTTADGLGNNWVESILEDTSGNLWFGTHEGGVSRYDGASWRTFTIGDVGAYECVLCILEDRSGNLWFGTSGQGVRRYDGSTWKTFTTADGLAGDHVQSILEDRSGNLWFGTAFGWYGNVSRYNGASWTTFTSISKYFGVTSILEDRAGNLWFGTANKYCGGFTSGVGVSRYDGSSWRTFTTADGLADNGVYSMVEDGSGNLWFGTFQGGASQYDGASWKTFTTADGLVDNVVHSVLEDRSGNLWFATFRGVSRYDGSSWRTFTTADGLVDNRVYAILEDRSGNLWFGTSDGGVSRYDGSSWRTFTPADGLAAGGVISIIEDRSGNLWFGTFGGGVSRYDGVIWRTFTTADGLADNRVYAMLEDRSGNLWFGTSDGGVSRYDGASWRTFTTADGLANNLVRSILEDRSGNLWFGTNGYGVSRYDGSTWRTFTTADGLGNYYVVSSLEDTSGNLWFGTWLGGVSRYDGASWKTFATADGLAANFVSSILEDRSGNLWFGTSKGASKYEPDRVAPRTLFLSAPPRLTAGRDHGFVLVAAYGETRGIEFSYRLDEDPWSAWSSVNSVFLTDLPDGLHLLEARARDFLGNTDPTPARATFEVDATPPAPVIASPSFGAIVRGSAEVRGTADDPRFRGYSVLMRPAGAATWDAPVATEIARGDTPVPSGLLATWDASAIPDGLYDLRLSVTDSLGLTGVVQVTVNVDNQFPYADVTAPARVVATTGGDIYTTNAEAHLYFPPHAFRADALVTVAALPADSVPISVSPQAGRVLPGYEIDWAGPGLSKPARLTLSYGGASLPSGVLAMYRSAGGGGWVRLGGTVEAGSRQISLAVTEPGRYALFAEQDVPSGPRTLSALSFTPRVFSPSGTFADRQVGIAFTLGRSGPVTIRVYNRAGRLVREVVSDQPMGAGSNLIRWDGRDRNGGYVIDGLYLVSVEALGQTQRKTLAVVR